MLEMEIAVRTDVGISALDENSRELINLGNELFRSQQAFSSHSEVERLFHLLSDRLLERFDAEKALFLEKGYPHHRDHLDQHEKILSQLAVLWERHRSNMLSLGELYRFLAMDLVRDHIGLEDAKAATYLKQIS